MYSLSDIDPKYLHTDALDYGLGGYLFQLIDGKETPIAFHWRKLNFGGQLYKKKQISARTYLKSLLRDRLLTSRTDHRNLSYIKNHSNPMIVRWLMAS